MAKYRDVWVVTYRLHLTGDIVVHVFPTEATARHYADVKESVYGYYNVEVNHTLLEE